MVWRDRHDSDPASLEASVTTSATVLLPTDTAERRSTSPEVEGRPTRCPPRGLDGLPGLAERTIHSARVGPGGTYYCASLWFMSLEGGRLTVNVHPAVHGLLGLS